jgi:hypothetical protein
VRQAVAGQAKAGMVMAQGRVLVGRVAEVHQHDAFGATDLDLEGLVRWCSGKAQALRRGQAALQAEDQCTQDPKKAHGLRHRE